MKKIIFIMSAALSTTFAAEIPQASLAQYYYLKTNAMTQYANLVSNEHEININGDDREYKQKKKSFWKMLTSKTNCCAYKKRNNKFEANQELRLQRIEKSLRLAGLAY